MPHGTVIIGTGQAGFQTAASLRELGYDDPVTLIGDEPHIPYQRPPLSKGFLLGKQDRESIDLRPAAFYGAHRIDLLAGERAAAIDTAQNRVELASGRSVPYSKLVLAVGARNRLLSIGGAELDGVLYLRSVDEAAALKERLENARNIAVIGGGFIGLELAAAAGTLGKTVTVLEALPRLMSRVVAPIISEYFSSLHAGRGVRIVCDCSVTEIAGSGGRVSGVALRDGRNYASDLVLVGVGVVPNVELARDAGLTVGNGIAVNEFLQTGHPDIHAIGDCAEFSSVFAGGRVRLESVQNAADQAQCVAANIAGQETPYRALPWFWTDQYETRLQMAGLSIGHDQLVTRGTVESGKFSAFYFKHGRLAAVDSINRPADHMLSRRLISSAVPLTPDQASDETFDLKSLRK